MLISCENQPIGVLICIREIQRDNVDKLMRTKLGVFICTGEILKDNIIVSKYEY